MCKSKQKSKMVLLQGHYDTDLCNDSQTSYQAMDSNNPTNGTSPASTTSTTSSTFYDIYGQSNIIMPSSAEQTPESYFSKQSVKKYQKKYHRYKYSPTRRPASLDRTMSEPIPIPQPRSPFRSYRSAMSPYVLHNPNYE